MASRDELAEKAVQSIYSNTNASDGGYDAACEILDAVLPQVSTVAELKSLPHGTKLLHRDGVILIRTQSWPSGVEGYASLNDSTFPLTVVWQP